MKNFTFEHEGQELTYTRAIVSRGFVFALDKSYNLMILANKKQGKWHIPSSKLEFDETIEECTCRAIQSETGVMLTPDYLELLEIHSAPILEQNVEIRYIAMCDTHTDEIDLYWDASNETIEDVQWINMYEVSRFEWEEGMLEFLTKLDPLIRELLYNEN